MWQVKNISFEYFMSHRKSIFEILQDKATMVYGKNLTDKGRKSNGSGKSALLEGICIAYLGEPLRNVPIKKLIKRGAEKCVIKSKMQNTKTSTVIEIERTFFSNTKSSEIDIKVNGQPLNEIPRNGANKYDVRDANKWILEQIEVSKEDLLNYFLVSKKQYKSFFALGDVAKKQVIGRFSQSNQIEPVFDVLKNEIYTKEQFITTLDTEIAVNNGKIEVYQEQINEFDFPALQQKDVDAAKTLKSNQIEQSASIKPLESLLEVQEKALGILKTQLTNIPQVTGSSEKDEQTLKQYKEELKKFVEEADEVMTKLTQYETNLRGVIKCPSCEHRWNPGKADVDVKQQEILKNKATTILTEIKVDVEAVGEDISEVEGKISVRDQKLTERRTLVRNKNTEISNKNTEVLQTGTDLTSAKSVLQLTNNQIIQLESKVIVDPTTELRRSINRLAEINEQRTREIEEKRTEIFDKKQWQNHFTRFKTHLSNKTIGVMQAHCNEYLERIGTDLSLNIEGYKVNKDKSIRETITTHVLRDGIDEGIIDQFSSGEEAQLIISMILTQQKLINASCKNGGFGLCFLDEIIESVDEVGILGLMNAMNSLGQSIIAITHGTFDQPYPHIVTVTKKNGNSEIG